MNDKRMRGRGFTIVELMVVIAIISILMTLLFSGVRGAMSSARERRTSALCNAVQSGLAAYHAQYDEWPGRLGGYVKSDNVPDRPNKEGPGNSHDPNKLVLEAAEVREMVKALVDEARKGNPLVDVAGLYVSRSPGEAQDKGYGMDFVTAVRGSSRSKKRMTTSEMYFGYPDRDTGRFRRFKMVYSIPTDSLSVSTQ